MFIFRWHDSQQALRLDACVRRDVVTSHDAVSMARSDFKKQRSAQQIADRLTKTAIQRRTEDNVSVVVIDLGGGKDGWSKPQQKNSDKWRGFLGLK